MYIVRVSARSQFGTAFVLFFLSDAVAVVACDARTVAMAILLWAVSLILLIFAIGAFINGLRIIWYSIKAQFFWWGSPT
jgi:hypothetical protein